MIPLRRNVPMALLILLAPSLGGLGGAAADGLTCAASPARAAQDDARSAGDAGDTPDRATLLPGPGWHYGAFTVPFENRIEDLHDWYALDVAAGGHTLTLDLQNQPNLILGMGNTVPLIYYLEVWREGATTPELEFASWAQPATLDADGERVLIHVYAAPLLFWDACDDTTPAPAGLGAWPDPLQSYGVFVACSPPCFP